MCTAISWHSLFGRNLDLWCRYGEAVVRLPRGSAYPVVGALSHPLLGVAHVVDGVPLYYDAMNDVGLAMAGLNFPHSAKYLPCDGLSREEGEPTCEKHLEPVAYPHAIPPYALIPYVLSRCDSCAAAKMLLANTTLVDLPYREGLPNSPLHWLIGDKTGVSLVVESTADGLFLYDDPVGVLTNEPPFPRQLANLRPYEHLSPRQPHSDTPHVSGGMGAVGLPGDWSSMSRFVRAAYVRAHLVDRGSANVGQFFHMLDSVAMPEGVLLVDYNGRETPEITLYRAVMELVSGTYTVQTYDDPTQRSFSVSEDEALVYPL